MRYANITSILSSYIGAFFSSLEDASPPGEDAFVAQLFDKSQFIITQMIRLIMFQCFTFYTKTIDL